MPNHLGMRLQHCLASLLDETANKYSVVLILLSRFVVESHSPMMSEYPQTRLHSDFSFLPSETT